MRGTQKQAAVKTARSLDDEACQSVGIKLKLHRYLARKHANTHMEGVFQRAYVINMADATARWAAVTSEFAAIGVPPTRIDAVRGRDLSERERAAMCTPGCASFCTPATIGCAASHVKLWRRVVADGVAVALAAEDDVQFVENFGALLRAYAAEFPPGWDVIYLGCVGCTGDEPVVARAALSLIGAAHESRDVSPHIWVPPTALTTHCYLVSAAGARKLLAAVEGRISTHIDQVMNRLMGERAIAAYAVRPLLTHQDISLAATSISTAKTPRGPSILLDKVRVLPEVTWGYLMSSPLCRVGRYTVNGWTPLFFAGGALMGACGASVAWALGFCVLLLLFDLLPLLKGDADTAVAVFTDTALAIAGWLTGLAVRAGISAACGSGGSKGKGRLSVLAT